MAGHDSCHNRNIDSLEATALVNGGESREKNISVYDEGDFQNGRQSSANEFTIDNEATNGGRKETPIIDTEPTTTQSHDLSSTKRRIYKTVSLYLSYFALVRHSMFQIRTSLPVIHN